MADIDSIVDEMMEEAEAAENQEETEDAGTAEQTEDAGEADETEADDDTSDAEDEADEADENDDDDDEEADDEEGDLISVLYEGEEVKVPLDELKRGYSGQRKVTEGLQANAAERKQIAEQRQQAEQVVQSVVAIAQNLQQTGVIPQPQMPDPDQYQDDPLGHTEAWGKYHRDVANFQQQQSQMQYLQSQQQQMQHAKLAEFRKEQAQILTQHLPEFADAEKRSRIEKDMVDYLTSEGVSQEQMQGINDALTIKIAYKAMQFDRLQAGKGKVAQKTANARPALKPGSKKPAANPQSRKIEAARKRLAKTGSLEDAVALQMVENPL